MHCRQLDDPMPLIGFELAGYEAFIDHIPDESTFTGPLKYGQTGSSHWHFKRNVQLKGMK